MSATLRGLFQTAFLGAGLLAGAGCSWLGFEEPLKPGDLSLKLGGDVELRLVLVPPMKLLVGKYEVTNGQYRKFKPGHNSGQHNGQDLNQDNQPAVNVSWKDATAFCAWLTKEYGAAGAKKYKFRLPTEKEWIAFAACGRALEYPWGSDWPPPAHWNYFGMENQAVGAKVERADKFQVSAPVRKSGVNAWGLYGTGGNVWEWTADKEGEQSRILKGGSWSDYIPMFMRLDRQSSYEPDYRYINLGFRVVAEPADQAPSKAAPARPADAAAPASAD